MAGVIIEATVTILILGLILAHANSFSTALRAVGTTYQQAVQTLAGVAGSGS